MQKLPIGEQYFARLRERNTLAEHMDELAAEYGVKLAADDHKGKFSAEIARIGTSALYLYYWRIQIWRALDLF